MAPKNSKHYLEKFGYENISKEDLESEIKRYIELGKDYSTIEFIKKYLLSNGLNGKPWRFDNSEYLGSEIKMKFICTKHGERSGVAKLLLRDSHKGCKQCGLENRKQPSESDYKKRTISDSKKELRRLLKGVGDENINRDVLKEQIRYYIGLGKESLTILFLTKNFIKNGYDVTYSFDKTEYTGSNKKVIVTCKNHGDFEILAMNVLVGKGCKKCSTEDQRIDYFDRIEEAKKIYGDRFEYDHEYNRANYVHVRDGFKLRIICPVHGKFEQTMFMHLSGTGCGTCLTDSKRRTYGSYIMEARKIHNNKYEYDHEYNKEHYKHVNDNFKLRIICPVHGKFEQRMSVHVHGSSGCPLCSESQMEKSLHRLFIEIGLEYNKDFFREKSFDDLISPKGFPLRFDFWLPKQNTLIELDGIQHFKFIDGMHKNEEEFSKQLSNDKLKDDYAKRNNITLTRIKYDEFDEWLETVKDNITERCHLV